MQNSKIINLPIVIGEIMADEKIRNLQAKLKQLSKKSKYPPVQLNNYNQKRNFSNLVYQNSGIYIIVNRKVNKFYVGKTTDMKEPLNDHRNRLFENSHRNKELQINFNTFKESLGIAYPDYKAIYDAFESDIVVDEFLKYELGEEDQTFFETVLRNLEDEIRDWFHANGYTNTYNDTWTAGEKQKLSDEKKHQLEEKLRRIIEKQRQKIEREQQKNVPYKIIKASFPNTSRNSVPLVDAEASNIYVNAKAAAEAFPKPVHPSNISAKSKNPLNKRYGDASKEEVQKKCYMPFYDYLFEDALKEALYRDDILINDYGYYVLNREKLEKERGESKKQNKSLRSTGIPQQALDAAVNSNAKPIVDVVTRKYYPSVAGPVKESQKLISEGKKVKRIHRTTIHNQVSDPLNKRYGDASKEEVQKKCYMLFYDHVFEDALKIAVKAGTVVMTKNGKKYTKARNFSKKINGSSSNKPKKKTTATEEIFSEEEK